MPLQATSGAASYDAFGGGAAVAPKYIEDFFQTWLRTGTGSSATVTTGLNASINKSLVWTKSRSAATNHKLTDTVRGATKALSSNTTSAEATDSQGLTAFGSTGYTIGTNTDYNNSGATYVDWQWLATPKFFDVVTYTGNGTSQNIAHNLGSVPGCIIVKDISNARAWSVYHTSLGNTQNLILSGTNAAATAADWNNTTPTSTQFTVGTNVRTNASGATYVAYLFAHDAGGFGLTGTDNVISCGSFTTDGSGIIPTVNLGYEPQWILAKPSSGVGNWFIMDNMRGWYNQQADQGNALFPNTSGAEAAGYNAMIPTATGFTGPALNFGAGVTYIYIAIRRGPMRTPTTGTSVFAPVAFTGNGSTTTGQFITSNFPVDMAIQMFRNQPYGDYLVDRLRGLTAPAATGNPDLTTSSTAAENVAGNLFGGDSNVGIRNYGHSGSLTLVNWLFGRAPGFFDEVCYTGTGSVLNVAHNLGVAPELMIVKGRSDTGGSNWCVYSAPTSAGGFLRLNSTSAYSASSTQWNNTAPTSTQFTLGTRVDSNSSGQTYVAYLFASCPGVSKVGSYTGTGTTQVINCGFTAGSRFVLIKRTDSTGDWYVWDSARGIVAGNDPYLLLNSTAAEVTNTDYIDTASTGFEISSTAPAAINASGGTFIFLAIA